MSHPRNIIRFPSSQGSPTPESSAGQCGGEKTGHSFARRSIEARLNGKPVHVTVGGVTLVDAIVMVLVAVFIGVLLGTGGGF